MPAGVIFLGLLPIGTLFFLRDAGEFAQYSAVEVACHRL